VKNGFIVLWLGLCTCRGGDAERPPADPIKGASGNSEASQDSAAGAAGHREGAVDSGSADISGDLGSMDATDPSRRSLDYDAELWTEVQAEEASIVLDIRYATADNFVGEPLYPCARCFMRPEAAVRLIEAHRALQAAGYGGLKLFDCYRPTPVQARLWEISPDPRAVAPPSKGSMHNRGLAIDLTVIDREGRELDMGTAYDAFSERSYHSFRDLPAEVRANRKMLRKTMAAAGFRPLRTEWWHYTLKGASRPLADFVWSCG